MENENHEEALLEIARRILDIEVQKARLQEDLKVIKQEAKDEGISVKVLTKALKNLKYEMKTPEADKFEEDAVTEMISNDPKVRGLMQDVIGDTK